MKATICCIAVAFFDRVAPDLVVRSMKVFDQDELTRGLKPGKEIRSKGHLHPIG